tara:strand:- start:339 stop:464 length:126 start_codon:yes stop_codon:yes gene_type:complete
MCDVFSPLLKASKTKEKKRIIVPQGVPSSINYLKIIKMLFN